MAKAVHARVHDIRKRITQGEVIIELRVPAETFPEVVELLDEQNVIVVVSRLDSTPFGVISSNEDQKD